MVLTFLFRSFNLENLSFSVFFMFSKYLCNFVEGALVHKKVYG